MIVPVHWQNLLPAHIQHAREFLKATESFERSATGARPDCFHKPSLFLAAHTVELALKCASLWLGKCECQLREDDGHKLLGPYNRLKSDTRSTQMIMRAETCVREKWKKQLRRDRGEYLESVCGYDEGILTNADIGQNLPKLADAVTWLDRFHAADGGALRYVRIGSGASVPVITCFGKTTPTVAQAVIWGCQSILHDLDQELRKG